MSELVSILIIGVVIYYIYSKNSGTDFTENGGVLNKLGTLVHSVTEDTKDIVDYTLFSLPHMAREHTSSAGKNPFLNSSITNYRSLIKAGDMIKEGVGASATTKRFFKIGDKIVSYKWTSQCYKVKSGGTKISVVTAEFTSPIILHVFGMPDISIKTLERVIAGDSVKVRSVITGETDAISTGKNLPSISIDSFVKMLKEETGWCIPTGSAMVDTIYELEPYIARTDYSKVLKSGQTKILVIPTSDLPISGFQSWGWNVNTNLVRPLSEVDFGSNDTGKILKQAVSKGSNQFVIDTWAIAGPKLSKDNFIKMIRNAYKAADIDNEFWSNKM